MELKWDNAVTESLMGIIKSECVHARTFESREQAAIELFDHIERFYNRVRIHSALGWLNPAEFEERNSQESRSDAAQGLSTKSGQIQTQRDHPALFGFNQEKLSLSFQANTRLLSCTGYWFDEASSASLSLGKLDLKVKRVFGKGEPSWWDSVYWWSRSACSPRG